MRPALGHDPWASLPATPSNATPRVPRATQALPAVDRYLAQPSLQLRPVPPYEPDAVPANATSAADVYAAPGPQEGAWWDMIRRGDLDSFERSFGK